MTTPVPMPSGAQVDLQSCADEPIHIPGTIQPHGALLFFSAGGRLEGWSANLCDLLGMAPALGAPYDSLALPQAVLELLAECVASLVDGEAPAVVAAVSVHGAQFDCIVHAAQGRIIAEFEARAVPADEVARFAVRAHGAIERLRRQKTIEDLVQVAVRQIRELTGFDRVMAYRFREDDSGDVVAEERRADLPPFLNQRYPASDIPAQARRLYVLNTLRMIARVGADSVALLGAPGAAPLDLSFATLRSSSPIHIEYLRNMGVGASMSVSLVANGRLWGMIACHHTTPKIVPYAIRMSADVLAQVIASTIQSIEARHSAVLEAESAEVRSSLVASMLQEDDPLDALRQHAEATLQVARAQALIALHFGKHIVHGDLPPGVVEAVIESLKALGRTHEMVQRERLDDWPPEVQARLQGWVGMLALPFDPLGGGWMVRLRPEQIEEIVWGGPPHVKEEVGPMGKRLTPRGSFDAWTETVRGAARPWEPVVLSNARLTLTELLRVWNERRAQTELSRAQLLAMLGHDLRDPLHSINMAGMVLQKGTSQPSLGKRIQSSSSRMQRLISQVLDMSRIDGGIPLGAERERLDLAALAEDLVDELRTAYPHVDIRLEAQPGVLVEGDGGRMAQVVSNLLSNARHHGEPGRAIVVRVKAEDGEGVLAVCNVGAAIPDDFLPALFDPFKRASMSNPRNRSGMGLGLYIAQQIVREHDGTLAYRYHDGHVVFEVRLPLPA